MKTMLTGSFYVSLMFIAFGSHAASVIFEEADVISSRAVYESVAVETPERSCWVEQVPVSYRSDHGVGLVVGGVVGGALGHAVGHRKRNKQVGALVGSVLGATVGNAIAKNRRHGHDYETRQRCETVRTVRHEERLLGYDVEYEYNGAVHHVRMQSNPGERIKLRVSHVPVV